MSFGRSRYPCPLITCFVGPVGGFFFDQMVDLNMVDQCFSKCHRKGSTGGSRVRPALREALKDQPSVFRSVQSSWAFVGEFCGGTGGELGVWRTRWCLLGELGTSFRFQTGRSLILFFWEMAPYGSTYLLRRYDWALQAYKNPVPQPH